MNDKEATERIAAFTQLDTETVSSQILPYVKTLPDARSLRGHLIDLIGPRKAQNSFMDAFIASRFPPSAPPAQPPSGPAKPTASASASAPSKAAPKAGPTTTKRGAASASATRPKGQSSKQAVDLSKAFGNSGAVYVKGQDQDPSEFFRRKGGAETQQANVPAHSTTKATTTSSASTPTPDSTSVGASSSSGPRAGQAPNTPSPATVSGTPGQASSSFVLAPTDEMKALDAELAELTTQGGSSTSPGAKERKLRPRTCYCQGRVHPLFKKRPICIHCGLLLCSLNLPTPLQPEAPCPSCGKVLLTQGERSALLSSLVSRREEAERQALIRAERVRAAREEQRRQAGGGGASSRDAAESLFPELSGGDAAARQRALEVDYALGRKQRGVEGETGVLRTAPARTGARVLTIGKKGKVTVGSTGKKKAKKLPASASSEPAEDTGKDKHKGAKSESGGGSADPTEARLDDHVGEGDDGDDDADAEEEAAAQEEARRLGIVASPEEGADAHAGVSHAQRLWFNPYLSIGHPSPATGDADGDGVLGFAYIPADVRAGFEADGGAEVETQA